MHLTGNIKLDGIKNPKDCLGKIFSTFQAPPITLTYDNKTDVITVPA
jgi:hypothetical protein